MILDCASYRLDATMITTLIIKSDYVRLPSPLYGGGRGTNISTMSFALHITPYNLGSVEYLVAKT